MNTERQDISTNSLAQAFISRTGPISPSVLRLGGGDSNISTIDQLEAVVVSDPEFSLRSLALANSAFYSLQHEIDSVRSALIVLGTDTVHTLAASMLAKSLHSTTASSEDELWLHCQATGIAAQMLSEAHQKENPRRAFAAGLLHDIGILALQVLHQENDVAFVHHAAMGAEIADLLGLSPVLSSAIGNHDHLGNMDFEDTPLHATIYIANEIATRCGFGHDRDSGSADETRLQSITASLALKDSDLDTLTKGLPARLQNHQAVIAGPNL